MAFHSEGVLSLLSLCLSVCLSLYLSVHLWTLPCLHNNSSQLWAAITTCAPDMHHGILWAGIENGGHQSWPPCSFWPFCLRILGNLACLHHNWYWIWVGITKFAPNMHLGILSVGIKNRVIDLDIQGHLAILTHKFCSTSLLYTNLGWSIGVIHSNILLFKSCFTLMWRFGDFLYWNTKMSSLFLIKFALSPGNCWSNLEPPS